MHISIYLYRISVTWIAVLVGKGGGRGKSACFTVDAACHVKPLLEWIWTWRRLGFHKTKFLWSAPGGLLLTLWSGCVFNERNMKCASHNPHERHPTRPACCLYLPAQGVTVTAWFLTTPRWKTNMPPDSESSSQRVFPFVYRTGFTSEQSPAMLNSDLAPNTHFNWSSPKHSGQM